MSARSYLTAGIAALGAATLAVAPLAVPRDVLVRATDRQMTAFADLLHDAAIGAQVFGRHDHPVVPDLAAGTDVRLQAARDLFASSKIRAVTPTDSGTTPDDDIVSVPEAQDAGYPVTKMPDAGNLSVSLAIAVDEIPNTAALVRSAPAADSKPSPRRVLANLEANPDANLEADVHNAALSNPLPPRPRGANPPARTAPSAAAFSARPAEGSPR